MFHQALRELLARRERLRDRARATPHVRGQGLRPGVDLDDAAALLDLMGRGDVPS
jgi:hypothetical protein